MLEKKKEGWGHRLWEKVGGDPGGIGPRKGRFSHCTGKEELEYRSRWFWMTADGKVCKFSPDSFSLWRRWWGLLDTAKIRAASPCRAGPYVLSLNHNETKFQEEENQRWAKERLQGFNFWCIIMLNSVQLFSPTSRWRSSSSPNHPGPLQGEVGRIQNSQPGLSASVVTVSLQGIVTLSLQTTTKISTLL